jgi:hypothetical protein
MLEGPSMTLRIGIGKAVGFAFGLAGFLLTPYFLPDAGPLIRWGILLWYTTVGAIIGVFGVYTRHPILKLPMPWWVRAPVIGAWMNFVLTFFAYEVMGEVLVAMFGHGGILQSPFWFAAEGALVGLVIGYFATRFGGEGAATVDHRAA